MKFDQSRDRLDAGGSARADGAAPTRRAFLGALLALGACGRESGGDILLFDGTGASPGSVTAIARILRRERFGFATADSAALNAMGPDRLRVYRLLIIPGGNFEVLGNALSATAAAAIRESVKAGLNYLGVCAGAFFAGASPYNGLDLFGGVRFGFYGLEARGVRKAAVPISLPGSPVIDHYWEDGPELSGWGEAVARYPDGKPAVVQGRVGRGWVLLTGIHAEADDSWRAGMDFATPARAANLHAAQIIRAARDGLALPHF